MTDRSGIGVKLRSGVIGLALIATACLPHGNKAMADQVSDGPLIGEWAIPPALSGGETLSSLGTEALRVAITPSFGRFSYYLSLQRLPTGCLPRDRRKSDGSDDGRACGTARVNVRRLDQFDHQVAQATFFLPAEEADALLEELDTRLARWRGQDPNVRTLDGTEVQIERLRSGKIESMASNALPQLDIDNPAAQLRESLLRLLLAYGPSGFAPRLSDWDVRTTDANEDLCNRPALATPLDHGFGHGNSDCDARRRWKL